MDTQRLILFVIFSFSALFLWERWQAEHRPPLPSPTTTAAKPSSDTPSAVPGAVPAAGVPIAPGASTPAPAAGEKISIRTDRYVADVDTLGGVITQVALTQHLDTDHADKPYLLLQKNENRIFLAQSGLIGEGLPNHHTLWQALPGPSELGPGMDKLELNLVATLTYGGIVGRAQNRAMVENLKMPLTPVERIDLGISVGDVVQLVRTAL